MLKRPLTRREFLRAGLAGVVLAGGGGLGYAHALEPEAVAVQPVRLTLPRLAPAFHGYRLVQISDLHLGDWLDRPRLAAIARQINAQQPDLVAITGDFVTHYSNQLAVNLVDVLGTLAAKDGVVAVLGNHDHWSNPDGV